VTPPHETLSRIDEAIKRFDRALEALRKIPQGGEEGVRINGIEHELIALATRLQSLREDVAGENRAE
jgi:hypothetical protein